MCVLTVPFNSAFLYGSADNAQIICIAALHVRSDANSLADSMLASSLTLFFPKNRCVSFQNRICLQCRSLMSQSVTHLDSSTFIHHKMLHHFCFLCQCPRCICWLDLKYNITCCCFCIYFHHTNFINH